MGSSKSETALKQTLDQVLGYLNFSSGTDDTNFLININLVFEQTSLEDLPATESFSNSEPKNCTSGVAGKVFDRLSQQLDQLCESNDTFQNSDQARAALDLAFVKFPAAYRRHHRHLLFHQPDNVLFNSFFMGRVAQAVLQVGQPWGDSDRILQQVIAKLNDFIGHRQVATLESQKIEPYEHEWMRPIPIYIKGAGAACGKYKQIVEIAIKIIQETDPAILRSAYFDPQRLDELGIDPRAFDFDHPINKRPNHHFGQWDPHLIDGSGYYRRFIVHQVTLDALLLRVDESSEETETSKLAICRQQLLYEAGAVLAGTILMASGISACGPGTFDSNTTLSHLLPVIAEYRDQFYLDLMNRLESDHKTRLLKEIEIRRQPFGGARQHLNSQLARRRASQLVNCRLASIFARMGFVDAAVEQSNVVPVASARILCQIDCLLSSATQAVKTRELSDAFEKIPKIMTLVKDGIDCGAIVDPWNILGFEATYSLFPANENTVPDHRAYELVEFIERILGLCSQLWSEAAAVDDLVMCEQVKTQFSGIVHWWRKYAAHEVMAVDAVDPVEIFNAAEHVARALNLWHKGGAAAGDISFWKEHAEMFDSPKAYALVIDALMQRSDYKTSTALLVNWLSRADQIRLQQGDSSFHNLVWRWITVQKNLLPDADSKTRGEIWNRIRKFYDFIEANAEHYGQVPSFELGRPVQIDDGDDDLDDDLDDASDENLFEAAYDDVIYHDTTDDGMEGAIFESNFTGDDELEAEVDRVMDRLEFLGTIASFWRIAATVPLPSVACTNYGLKPSGPLSDDVCQQLENRRNIVSSWINRAAENLTRLNALLNSVYIYPLPATGADHESMVQYDRHRLYKESLLERIVATCVEMQNATYMLAAVSSAINHLIDNRPVHEHHANDCSPLVTVFSTVMLANPKLVLEHFPSMIDFLHTKSLLYVPLAKGGAPDAIVDSRVLQSAIRDLLGSLPLLGLLLETYELTKTALAMERNQKIAQGAVTEFDDLFQVAYTSMVKCLIRSTRELHDELIENDDHDRESAAKESESVLFDCVEMVTESMLIMWLTHSRTLRLTVLEKVNDEKSWNRLVEFIQRYGAGLFTQQFLQLANVRAILHQGVNVWLENAKHSPVPLDLRLLDELDTGLPRQQAVRYLTLILDAVYENYNEYRDYNTTTTQSDRGELLYSLLDFLRLRGRYDRVCWNLKPVVWGHEILVRDQQNAVARMWRRSLTERVGPEANKYLEKLETLRNQYSIQMSSVGRQLEGRFAHPMQIDRLRSLVGPAMVDPSSHKCNRIFELLEHETQAFARATAGVGVDLPAWLAALENEVEQHHLPLRLRETSHDQTLTRPIKVPVAELREQLEQLPRRHK